MMDRLQHSTDLPERLANVARLEQQLGKVQLQSIIRGRGVNRGAQAL